MPIVYLTSQSPIKKEVLKEFIGFFPGYEIKSFSAKTSICQPIGNKDLVDCIDQRINCLKNEFTINENDIVISFENGIISDGTKHYDICLMRINDEEYCSFRIEVPKGLWNDYHGKHKYSQEFSNMTFGQYLSTKYPVTHDNWMSNYRFGGIDRKDQLYHCMTQYLIEKNTRIIPDYPKPGVIFKDISSVMANTSLRKVLMDEFVKMVKRNYANIDFVASLESRGHYFGPSLAVTLNTGFIPIRKASKLPNIETVHKVDYGTEYSQDSFGLIVDDPSIFSGKRVLIVDDLLATGGSLRGATNLLESCDMNVLGSAVVYSVPPLENQGFNGQNVSVLLSSHELNYDIVRGTEEVQNESSVHSNIMTKSLERYDMPIGNTKIISCIDSEDLAIAISRHGNIPICKTILGHFNNGETRVEITENIRGNHIIVICRTRNGVLNDDFMSLCMILDACNRAGCGELTVVLPYYPYARSDKKDQPRVPIGSAAIANILNIFDINNIISLDLHSGQSQGLIKKGFHNLYIIGVMCRYIKSRIITEKTDFVLVSPDAGSIKRIEAYSKKLQMNYVILHKQRDYSKPGTVMNSTIIGDPEIYQGKTGIIIDDMADTMGTVVAATNVLKQNGLKDVIVIVTHGVLSGPAIDRINNCDFIKKMIVTNSLPQKENLSRCPKLYVLDASDLITRTLVAISKKESVSELFE